MYRGRLIFPLLAEIFPLDPYGTNAAGYDPIYREPKLTATADGLGTSVKSENAAIRVPAQISPTSLQRLAMMGNGDVASGRVIVLMHFQDLEALGLVDT